ncbi:SUKH-4 family immunity protein [Amycolatopsis taiwanensis]|uniref:SUKH-4 immunity protein of toxin-antitoxin system n=1 Tax=Amycolatopsis taiwanensis TaxID=342230 RepID=A0A9W6VFZ7_9PSEU|nr:SUKH-4 family immunity protein [Amycolatopsis taiwanensis]GLY65409.1 hypothetical protein Atai01_20280 [Amycolatopsis taiwanensis]
MITRQDMLDLYGSSNLVTVPSGEVDRFRLRAPDAEVLATVGLPRFSSPFFTTEVQGGPEFRRVIDVTTRDGKDHREVIIGGPPGDSGMRFSISAYEGFITLVQLQGDRPRGEVVNNNLGEFVEFLYRLERYRLRVEADPASAEEEFEELSDTLMRIDPFSFELEENWWSIALRQLGGAGIGE